MPAKRRTSTPTKPKKARILRKSPRATQQSPSRVLRAASELGRGDAILVEAGDGTNWLMVAAETLRDPVAAFMAQQGRGEAELWLSRRRAETLKVRLYTGAVAVLIFKAPLDTKTLRAIADPSLDMAQPLAGPFQVRREALGEGAETILKLLKGAGLLPAAVVVPVSPARARTLERQSGLLRLRTKDIDAFADPKGTALELITQARVPLEHAVDTNVLAFRETLTGTEHLALLIGSPDPAKPPLVRLHSACLTGDVMGSLKCDCGAQLKGAIARMGKEPTGGVLLYLAQEGRGIGLLNKLRAYRLQDQGFDTVDANLRLGFEADERTFSAAAGMLKWLGLTHIRLLTNNPDKVAALEAFGVRVAERIPHHFPDNPHNAHYLKTKARRSGHLL